MYDFPTIATLVLATLFGVVGAVQLAGPRVLREAYTRWDYPPRLRIVTGLLDLAAAAMLLEPDTRAWGIALAGSLTFGSVVTLLNHRQYAWAAAAILMMAALVPATLAVPRGDQVQFVAPASPLFVGTR